MKLQWLKKQFVYALSCMMVLSGCVTNSGTGTGGGGPVVGPQTSTTSSASQNTQVAAVNEATRKLDVIIPVFDPGLEARATSSSSSGDPSALFDSDEKTETKPAENVWPELRRAEANRFAYNLKKAMDATGAFGAVRVTPDQTATGDLYVLGRIIESNGEEVAISTEVVDISGKRWFSQTFDHTVDASFHSDIRNNGLDPYAPVFDEAANRIAEELDDYSTAELERLSQLTELRFGASMSEEAFSEHLEYEGGTVKLASLPSEDDPMLNRTRAVRVRDQLFVDGLQDVYRSFSDRMAASYLIWQEQSLLEIQAKREVERKAAGQAALGAAAIALAILAATAGSKSKSTLGKNAGTAGAVLAGAAGAVLLADSFQTSKETEVHRDALNELGESINVDLGPQVVEFEQKTLNLTGDAKEQFAKWRAFLQKIYLQERTPEKKIL